MQQKHLQTQHPQDEGPFYNLEMCRESLLVGCFNRMGIKPNTSFISQAGEQLNRENKIVYNKRCKTLKQVYDANKRVKSDSSVINYALISVQIVITYNKMVNYNKVWDTSYSMCCKVFIIYCIVQQYDRTEYHIPARGVISCYFMFI